MACIKQQVWINTLDYTLYGMLWWCKLFVDKEDGIERKDKGNTMTQQESSEQQIGRSNLLFSVIFKGATRFYGKLAGIWNVGNRTHDIAEHRIFSRTLHEFPGCCSSDRTTCPLIHTALPHKCIVLIIVILIT